MFKTEDEARKTGCPLYALIAVIAASHGARNLGNESEARRAVACQASQCMAWRWANPAHKDVNWEGKDDPHGIRNSGYCGAFGRPE